MCENQYVGLKADACSQCPGGIDCTSDKLPTDCPSGFICILGELEAKACPSGYFCPKKTELDPSQVENKNLNCLNFNEHQATHYQCQKLLCPKGYFCPESTQGFIESIFDASKEFDPNIHLAKPLASYKCEVNFYQDELGKSECKPCPQDTGTWDEQRINRLVGRTSADQCLANPGFWLDGNSIKPLSECNVNQFEEEQASPTQDRKCKECPEGFYCNGFNQSPCPSFYSCAAGAGSADFDNKDNLSTSEIATAKIIPCIDGQDCSEEGSIKGQEKSCPSDSYCLAGEEPKAWAPECISGQYLKQTPSLQRIEYANNVQQETTVLILLQREIQDKYVQLVIFVQWDLLVLMELDHVALDIIVLKDQKTNTDVNQAKKMILIKNYVRKATTVPMVPKINLVDSLEKQKKKIRKLVGLI